MPTEDHKNMKKIQAWIPLETWDKIVSLGYTSPTIAVSKAFEKLLEDPRTNPLVSPKDPHKIPERSPQDPIGSPDIPDVSPKIPELNARIEGLQLLLEEREKRIEDLKRDLEDKRREVERLDFYAHFFKSLEHKHIEAQIIENNQPVMEGEKKEEKKEEPVIESKPSAKKRDSQKGDKAPIKKICKNCNQPFFAKNPKQSTCSQKCRTAYNRRK